MTLFINAEYVIAKLLIESVKSNKYKITLDDVNTYNVKLQKETNRQNIDVVFLTSEWQIENALIDYSEYFEFDKQSKIIKIAHTKDIQDLDWHFTSYLPINIVQIMENCKF